MNIEGLLPGTSNEQLFWLAYSCPSDCFDYGVVGAELDGRISEIKQRFNRQLFQDEIRTVPLLAEFHELNALEEARQYVNAAYGTLTGFKRTGGCAMSVAVRYDGPLISSVDNDS